MCAAAAYVPAPWASRLDPMAALRIVVPVLITSCQVSLKRKIGPVSAHTRMMDAASAKVIGRPLMWAVPFVSRVNQLRDFVGRMEALRRESVAHDLVPNRLETDASTSVRLAHSEESARQTCARLNSNA